jgi:hypothetical protein
VDFCTDFLLRDFSLLCTGEGEIVMTREGILLEKEPGLKTIFQGEEHLYVRCVIADSADPERHFECRVLDEEDIPNSVGEAIKLEVVKVVTERRSGVVRFDCRLIKTPE